MKKIEQEQNDLAEKGPCSRTEFKMILKSQHVPSSMGTKTCLFPVLKSTLNNFDWAVTGGEQGGQ